ncbi:hypothetical protein JCM9533A_70890 [Catenuloplanes niger JCM 9533]
MRCDDRTDVLGQRRGVQDTGEPQRPAEGPTPLRQREASRIEVQVCASARQPATRVGPKLRTDRDEPQDFRYRYAAPTADTCSDWRIRAHGQSRAHRAFQG